MVAKQRMRSKREAGEQKEKQMKGIEEMKKGIRWDFVI
jgi:hypothetical protein